VSCTGADVARPSTRPGQALGRLARGAAALVVGAGILAACTSATTTVGGCGITAGTYCVGTYMKGADMAQADLFGSNLSRADLRHADLRGAVLDGATLEYTNLQGVDFRQAQLVDANFDHADLRGARFEGALLAGASFVGAIGVTAAELRQGTVCRTLLAPGVWLSRDC